MFLFRPTALTRPKPKRLVRQVIADSGIDVEFSVVQIVDAEQAQRRGFLGSPTIQVNGLDVDPTARVRTFSGFA